jgi:TatD DNase family protein
MPPWIDTHCHLDAREFGGESAAVHARSRAAGVAACLIPAVAPFNYAAVRELAHAQGDAYALGIHPMCTPGMTGDDLAATRRAVEAALADPRFVAVGEIGLDYFVPGLDDAHQTTLFREQLRIARDHDLPVILHVRRSADRVLRQLREVGAGTHVWRGVAHAFNGSEQQAGRFIDFGLKLGFGGALTFDRALQIRRVAQAVPLSAIVMETDSPDIPPHWLYRTAEDREGGQPQARNEPSQLPRIGAVLAELRGLSPEALAEATTRNAIEAFPRLAALVGPPHAGG